MAGKGTAQFDKMTKTPVSRLILTLAVPTVISMLVTNVYNLVDTAFVGQLGNSASGAVGVVFGYMAILQAIGFMCGQGGGSLVARLLGAQKEDDASRHASTAICFSFTFGLAAALLTTVFMDPVISFLGSTDTIRPHAKVYIRYILIAAPFITSSFTMNNILRFEGKAVLGMVCLFAGAVVNMAGDPILMFGFDMGLAGAGLSTCLSQILGFCLLLSMFLRRKTTCRLQPSFITPALLGNICATGLPSLLRQGLQSAATIILNWEVRPYGDAAVAAMSIVSRVTFFVFSVAIGIGQGFQPVSGFNYGAGYYSRVRKGYRFTLMAAEGLIMAATTVMFLLSGSVIGIFRDDPEVIRIATRALRLQCGALWFFPVAMVTEMMLQSTGHKVGASVLSSLRSGICFIPTLLILAHLRGLAGIQEAQPLAYVLSFFPGLAFGIWMMKKMPAGDHPVGSGAP